MSAFPALILIHGATLNAASWNPIRRHLDPQFRTVAVDLPGHGMRSDEPYTLERAMAVIAATARELAPSKVVLIGDSLGGYTSMASASSIPAGQLVGLIIGGCSANFAGAQRRAARRRWALFRIFIALFGEERLVRKRVTKLLRKMGHTEADIADIVVGHVRLRAFPEAVAAIGEVDFLSKVKAIQVPVVFFNGEKDKFPVASEAKFVAAAPRGESKRFPGEHGVTLWHPKDFAEFVMSCLEGFSAASGK